MAATLTVLKPGGRIIPLIPPLQTIGRSSKCDIQLTPLDGFILTHGENKGFNSVETVSRVHAQFTFVNGRWMLTDLGSLSGTTVNSVKIGQDPVPLQNDSEIGLAAIRLLFHEDVQDLATENADKTGF